MRLLVSCCVLLTLATVIANGQSSADQEREAICKTVACRESSTVKLKLNNKEYAEFNFPKGPFVADGFINILSGEHFAVEFEEKNGELLNPRFVKEIVHPERTMLVDFLQIEKGMVLKVSNPFTKTIIYDCLIQHYQQERLSKTSIMPVGAKLAGYELWPYPIPQVVISNVRYQSSSTE
ncbi:MAG TPA: hypothetical protein VIF64_17620 [Pyrinomonadaceae bacterium]|jgi:hypothetical protein